jgi:hypothetical protein
MVRLFHDRFWIEQGYQQFKEELGLDHHFSNLPIGKRPALPEVITWHILCSPPLKEVKRISNFQVSR